MASVSRRILVLTAAVMLASVAYPVSAAQRVTVFNTYLVPPFWVDTQQGLAQSLVAVLNAKLGDRYTFTLNNVPRKRMDTTELAKAADFDGLMLFINPVFVGDTKQTRFLWSKPLFVDCNLIISNRADPLVYDGLVSLPHWRFGGVASYHYPIIDDLVAAGKASREDAPDEVANLRKVAAQHIDATSIPYSIYSYYATDPEFSPHLRVATTPLGCFSRYILFGRKALGLQVAVNQVVEGLAVEPAWLQALAKFNIDPARLVKWTAAAPAPD